MGRSCRGRDAAGLGTGSVAVLFAFAVAASAIKLPPEVPRRVAAHIHVQLSGGATAAATPVVVMPSNNSAFAAEAFEVWCDARTGWVTVRGGSRLALMFGLYELAVRAGFGFLHPLHVVTPEKPAWCQTFSGRPSDLAGDSEVGAVRGSHLHTQHPIELANLLNGVGRSESPAGHGTPSEDAAAWAAGLPTWTLYLQWLVANKQNLVEWGLLEWGSPDGFSMSAVRKQRLADLVARAQEWGLKVAIDAPVNLQQQHAWRIWPGGWGDAWGGMVRRLDWLCDLGIDEVSTEMGSTEFTHTDAHQTVDVLDKIVDYLATKGRRLIVKNHASTKQVAKGFQDPLNPLKDLNFNYLTYYADSRVVSAPHTVQMYGLEDPLVGSYGRQNYSDIRAMMRLLEAQGKPQVFFPETSYWVNFDNSVPLVLPLYAAARLRDLQLLAVEAPRAGHLNFESGWAIGYWINNAAQALAVWRRDAGMTLAGLFQELLRPLGQDGAELSDILVQLTTLQNRTLVHDVFVTPSGARQTLMSYLEGWEGMAEAQEAWQFAVVQPPRVHPRNVMANADWYLRTLAPRLDALARASQPLANHCAALRSRASAGAPAALIRDACVGVELFALRVEQVRGLYAAAAGASPERGIASSAEAIKAGLDLVSVLGLHPEWTEWTGVSWPTAYPYGYLWPAASLFFWRRDHQLVARGIQDPCYLNLYDIVELGLPYSPLKAYVKSTMRGISAMFAWLPWFNRYAGCLSGPPAEPSLDAVGELAVGRPSILPAQLYFWSVSVAALGLVFRGRVVNGRHRMRALGKWIGRALEGS